MEQPETKNTQRGSSPNDRRRITIGLEAKSKKKDKKFIPIERQREKFILTLVQSGYYDEESATENSSIFAGISSSIAILNMEMLALAVVHINFVPPHLQFTDEALLPLIEKIMDPENVSKNEMLALKADLLRYSFIIEQIMKDRVHLTF